MSFDEQTCLTYSIKKIRVVRLRMSLNWRRVSRVDIIKMLKSLIFQFVSHSALFVASPYKALWQEKYKCIATNHQAFLQKIWVHKEKKRNKKEHTASLEFRQNFKCKNFPMSSLPQLSMTRPREPKCMAKACQLHCPITKQHCVCQTAIDTHLRWHGLLCYFIQRFSRWNVRRRSGSCIKLSQGVYTETEVRRRNLKPLVWLRWLWFR